jgi:hypothetical protein
MRPLGYRYDVNEGMLLRFDRFVQRFSKRIRVDHVKGLRPFQESLHKSSPVAGYVKRPHLPLCGAHSCRLDTDTDAPVEHLPADD